ncbi:hypothetical protein ABPG75_004453 [Micractinium tetrahymenae]
MERAGNPLRQFYVAVSSTENKLATLLDLLRAFEASAPLSLVACCGSRDSLDSLVAASVGVAHCRVWVLHADLSEREVEATVRDYQAATRAAQQAERQQAQQQQQEQGVDALGERQEQAGGAAQQRQGQVGAAAALGGSQQGGAAPIVAVGHACSSCPGVLATTDAGLRSLPKELLPLSPTLLISFDLPTRKDAYLQFLMSTSPSRPGLARTQDAYLRRITGVLGSRSSAGGQRIAVNFAVAGQLDEFRQVEEFSEKPIEQMPVHVGDILA